MSNNKSGIGSESKIIEKLYSLPLPSSRTGPIYNAFPYPTKISPEAIAVFIATHTKPGSKILDVFGGSGTTGLATLLCDKPTSTMLEIAKKLNVSPNWGPREAVIYEIGSLGSLSARVLSAKINIDQFEKSANHLLNIAKDKIGWIYQAASPKGEKGIIRYIVWSDILECPNCGVEESYYQALIRRKPFRLDKTFICKNCRKKISVEECGRGTEYFFDSILNKRVLRKKRIPVIVYGVSPSGNWSRTVNQKDIDIISRIGKIKTPSSAPISPIDFGDLYRSGYHVGITHLHHFYTLRNFYAVATIWDLISEFPENIQDALRLLLLSYNASHSTLMSRVVVKKGEKDFVITGAQSGVLYISGMPVEKNVLSGVDRKITAFVKAFKALEGSQSKVKVFNSSSTKLKLADNSIDYVFTDPPFGDYIPYSETNQINEIWLGNITNKIEEIIISPSQGKDVDKYGQLLTKVFKEVSRVLKANGHATVVFHSAHPEVWKAFANALETAKLYVKNTSILDKLQSSFKQVVSSVFVHGDPIILLSKKKTNRTNNPRLEEDVFADILHLAKKSRLEQQKASFYYSKFVSQCFEEGIKITISAKDFQKKLGIKIK